MKYLMQSMKNFSSHGFFASNSKFSDENKNAFQPVVKIQAGSNVGEGSFSKGGRQLN